MPASGGREGAGGKEVIAMDLVGKLGTTGARDEALGACGVLVESWRVALVRSGKQSVPNPLDSACDLRSKHCPSIRLLC